MLEVFEYAIGIRYMCGIPLSHFWDQSYFVIIIYLSLVSAQMFFNLMMCAVMKMKIWLDVNKRC